MSDDYIPLEKLKGEIRKEKIKKSFYNFASKIKNDWNEARAQSGWDSEKSVAERQKMKAELGDLYSRGKAGLRSLANKGYKKAKSGFKSYVGKMGRAPKNTARSSLSDPSKLFFGSGNSYVRKDRRRAKRMSDSWGGNMSDWF